MKEKPGKSQGQPWKNEEEGFLLYFTLALTSVCQKKGGERQPSRCGRRVSGAFLKKEEKKD